MVTFMDLHSGYDELQLFNSNDNFKIILEIEVSLFLVTQKVAVRNVIWLIKSNRGRSM